MGRGGEGITGVLERRGYVGGPAGFLDGDHDRLDADSAEGVGAVEGVVGEFHYVAVQFLQPGAEGGGAAGPAEAELETWTHTPDLAGVSRSGDDRLRSPDRVLFTGASQKLHGFYRRLKRLQFAV
jgi:hypothetical protein